MGDNTSSFKCSERSYTQLISLQGCMSYCCYLFSVIYDQDDFEYSIEVNWGVMTLTFKYCWSCWSNDLWCNDLTFEDCWSCWYKYNDTGQVGFSLCDNCQGVGVLRDSPLMFYSFLVLPDSRLYSVIVSCVNSSLGSLSLNSFNTAIRDLVCNIFRSFWPTTLDWSDLLGSSDYKRKCEIYSVP